MIEFLIAGADTKEYFRILKYIVYPVLKEDPLWHFFNEEEQGLIVRCSDEFQNILEETLGEHELSSSYTYWSKDHTIVMENWEYMKKIFHMNSEFAMENTLKYGPTCQFVDRIVHSKKQCGTHCFHRVLSADIVGDEKFTIYFEQMIRGFLLLT